MLKNLSCSNKITNLTLFTSESCNLQCKYCDMASHINAQKHKEEAQKVKESLINGQYLETIIKAMERLQVDPKQILHFELWGQEPTLTLKEFTVMFPKLYNYCENIGGMLFSTNGVSGINNILYFIDAIIPLLNKSFKFTLQFSYDGAEPTKKNRGIEPNIILNNISNFLTQLNKRDLGKYLKITVQFHNVISADIINYFADNSHQQELFKFLQELSDLSEKFITLNTNTSVKVFPFSPGLINPYNASVEDGKNLYKFYRNCQAVDKNLKHSNYIGLAHQFYTCFVDFDYDDVLPFLTSLNNFYYLDKTYLTRLSPRLSCGFNYGGLKVRYDGTMLICQNALMGLTQKELENRTDTDALIQKRRILKNFYPNILTDSDEIIDNYLYEVSALHEESFLSAYSQTANLMALLLYAGQIDKKYNNQQQFLQTAYHITVMFSCPYNGMMQGGSLYSKYAGCIRFFCNGFMDIIYEEAQKFMTTHKKGDPINEYN